MASGAHDLLCRRWTRFLSAVESGKYPQPAWFAINNVLKRLDGRGWKGYVVGGTIRDLLLGPPDDLPRDIDFMVQGAGRGDLDSVFGDLVQRRTRFGGLHLAHTFHMQLWEKEIDGTLLFDVWRIEDTWGIRNEKLVPSVSNFVKTPFLNIDSIAVEFCSGPARIVEHGFFRAVTERLLDLNYEPNPFPFVCAIRSLIMAAKLDFALSPKLGEFILHHYRQGSSGAFMAAQVSHYGMERCSQQEVQSWIDQIMAALDSGLKRIMLATGKQRQIELWNDWPPMSARSMSVRRKAPPRRKLRSRPIQLVLEVSS